MEALKATFRIPGVLAAALGYYRATLNPLNQDPALAEIQARLVASPIDVPTLMIHGGRDGCIGRDLLVGMEMFFPRGLQIEVIPDAGHFVHQEQPEVVNRLLLAFLREVKRPVPR